MTPPSLQLMMTIVMIDDVVWGTPNHRGSFAS